MASETEPPTTAAPMFASWEDFLTRATGTQVRQMCHARTKKANAARLFSAAPERKLTARDVWDILAAARGRCVHCGSFCVERLPYDGSVKLSWEQVGRRIGSVDHIASRVDGGGNKRENLAWACLWCNTWPSERQQGPTDHGGLYPPDDGDRRPLPRRGASASRRPTTTSWPTPTTSWMRTTRSGGRSWL